MIYFVIEFSTVLFDLLFIHIFFGWWFGYRNKPRPQIALYFLAYLLLRSIITFLPVDPVIRVVVNCFFVFGISYLSFDTAKISALFSSLLFMVLGILSESFSYVIVHMFSFDGDALMAPGNARTILISLAVSVRLITVLIAASILKKNQAALTFRQLAPILPCLAVCIFICIVFFIIFPYLDESMTFLLLIALAGLLYVCGIIVLNTQAIKNTVYEIERQRTEIQHFEMQKQYYQKVITDREETRAMRHDMKKYVTALEALVESFDIDTAKNEYAQIRKAYENLGSVVDTESDTLNAILQHNIDKAEVADVPVSHDIRVTAEFNFPAVDLSVIVGNTFDNAIDECVLLKDNNPQIYVSIIQQNHMLFYEIKNPCSKAPREKPGRLHGYGLKNVRRLVEKHFGSMDAGISGDEYIVSIRVNLRAQ